MTYDVYADRAALAEALNLLKRALNYIPDGQACECDIRRFLEAHDPVWAGAYSTGRVVLRGLGGEPT